MAHLQRPVVPGRGIAPSPPTRCPLPYPDHVEDTMIQRLRRAAALWPRLPRRPIDLSWRDPSRGPEPDKLDRLLG